MSAERVEEVVALTGDQMYCYLQGLVTGAGLALEGDETTGDLIEAAGYLAASRARR